jgi:anti-anti-sigma factor
VVRLPERLTHDTSIGVRLAIERSLPNRDGAALVLDMADVSLVTSLGVATLLQIQEFCRDRGAPMRVAGLSVHLRSFFEMLGLEDKFELADNVDEAVVALGG